MGKSTASPFLMGIYNIICIYYIYISTIVIINHGPTIVNNGISRTYQHILSIINQPQFPSKNDAPDRHKSQVYIHIDRQLRDTNLAVCQNLGTPGEHQNSCIKPSPAMPGIRWSPLKIRQTIGFSGVASCSHWLRSNLFHTGNVPRIHKATKLWQDIGRPGVKKWQAMMEMTKV